MAMKLLRHINPQVRPAMKMALTGLACVFLAGCVNDADLCPPEETRGEGSALWLNLHVTNQTSTPGANNVTRADGDDCSHDPEDASIAENYINTKDLDIVLLNENRSVMKRFEQGEYTLAWLGNEHSTTYELYLKVNKGLFDLTKNNVTMYLAMTANKNGADNGSTAVNPFMGQLGLDISEFAAKTDINRYAYTPDTTDGWWPIAAEPEKGGRYIPMAGIMKVTAPSSELTGAGEDDCLYLDEMQMQRAMAKMRVTGNFADQYGEYGEIEKILSVTLCGVHPRGSLLPYYDGNESWYTAGTKNIETASIPENPGNAIDIPFFQEGESFICYLPEYALVKSGNIELDKDSKTGPYLKIRTQDHIEKEQGGGVGEIRDHEVYLSSFANFSNISRNHIYDFTVEGRESHKIGITVTAMPWDTPDNLEDYDYDYSGQVGVGDDGEIEWVSGVNSFTKATFSVEVMPWTSEYEDEEKTIIKNPEILTGTFTLDSPRNSKWTASLISMKGDIDNFGFVYWDIASEDWERDEDGRLVTHRTVEGIIDGKQSRINIVPRRPLSETQQEAKLQVRVTLPNGQIIIADIAGSGSEDGRSYHTIVQNALTN